MTLWWTDQRKKYFRSKYLRDEEGFEEKLYVKNVMKMIKRQEWINGSRTTKNQPILLKN